MRMTYEEVVANHTGAGVSTNNSPKPIPGIPMIRRALPNTTFIEKVLKKKRKGRKTNDVTRS